MVDCSEHGGHFPEHPRCPRVLLTLSNSSTNIKLIIIIGVIDVQFVWTNSYDRALKYIDSALIDDGDLFG